MGTRLASMTAWTCCWFPAVMLDRNHTASCERTHTHSQHSSGRADDGSGVRRARGSELRASERSAHRPCWGGGAGRGAEGEDEDTEALIIGRTADRPRGERAPQMHSCISTGVYDTRTRQPLTHAHTHYSELNIKHMLIWTLCRHHSCQRHPSAVIISSTSHATRLQKSRARHVPVLQTRRPAIHKSE